MNIGEKLIQNYISGCQVNRSVLFHYIGIGTLISKKLLRENSTAIEVGIGRCLHNTLEYTKLFKTVYAIDAHRHSYEIMLRHITENQITNLEPYNYFLSDKQETVQFHCNDDDIGYSTRYFDMIEAAEKHLLPNWSTIEMQSTTLDDVFFDKVEDLSFIKIDAENSDIAIIKGAENIIQKWRPMIQFEHWNDTQYISKFCIRHKYQYIKNVDALSFILIPRKGK